MSLGLSLAGRTEDQVGKYQAGRCSRSSSWLLVLCLPITQLPFLLEENIASILPLDLEGWGASQHLTDESEDFLGASPRPQQRWAWVRNKQWKRVGLGLGGQVPSCLESLCSLRLSECSRNGECACGEQDISQALQEVAGVWGCLSPPTVLLSAHV